MAWFCQAFYYSKFAILVGMPMPEFLRSCLIVSGDAPDCLNFDIRPLRYYNGLLWLVSIDPLWLVAFLAEL
ncbi:unnamed protein product [Prunus brigantina]